MLRSRPTQRWVDCGRHHGRQTGRRARQLGLSPRHDFLRGFFRINWDTSTGRPYYKSPGENVCVRFGWGEDLGKHAPARHGSPLPFGRTRSKRIVDDPARNQCLGARSLGQTLVKLDRAESRRRTLGRGTSLLTEVLPANQIEYKLFGCLANQLLRHFVKLAMSISKYHLIC
jgi:hypothetical protein